MESLIIIIGDNFIGGIEYYKATIRAMKIRKIPISPIQIVSNKRILGLDDEVIVSPNLTKMLKNEDWIFTVPGQPGLYGIVPSAYNGIGIMTIPARGGDTANFIKDIQTSYPELSITIAILKPSSINGSLNKLVGTYGLSDEVASKIYSDYKEHTEWRENIVPDNFVPIDIEYPSIPSSPSAAIGYLNKLVDKFSTIKNI